MRNSHIANVVVWTLGNGTLWTTCASPLSSNPLKAAAQPTSSSTSSPSLRPLLIMIARRETARLLCCFTPLQCCGFRMFSLRLGVVIWTLCDLLLGCTALAQAWSLLPAPIHLQKSNIELGLLISALPFAFLGLLGALSVHRAKLDVYCCFKRLELMLVVGICVCEASQLREDTWETVCSFLFFASFRLILDFYGTYIAWSSVIKLRSCGSFLTAGKASIELTQASSYEAVCKATVTV